MPPPNPIRATGVILAARGPRLYDAALPNGCPVTAFVTPKKAAGLEALTPGARVHLELTAYDFSTARIAGLADQEEVEARPPLP